MKKSISAGFTIVETMIFLAISSVLLVSALYLVNGQQNSTEFSTAVRDIESQLRDVINDVSTGVYSYRANSQCYVTGAGVPPTIDDAAVKKQGTNLGCTFIGRVFQFSPHNDTDHFYVYSVVGRQFSGSGPTFGDDITNLWTAKPVAISPRTTDASIPDATDKLELRSGLRVEKMTYNDGAGDVNIGAFGIFTNFTRTDGDLNTIKQNSDFWPIPNSVLNQTQLAAAEKIYEIGTAPAAAVIPFRNPENGINVCFVNGRVPQHGLITIGNQNGRLTANLIIGNGSCP